MATIPQGGIRFRLSGKRCQRLSCAKLMNRDICWQKKTASGQNPDAVFFKPFGSVVTELNCNLAALLSALLSRTLFSSLLLGCFFSSFLCCFFLSSFLLRSFLGGLLLSRTLFSSLLLSRLLSCFLLRFLLGHVFPPLRKETLASPRDF